MRPWSTGSRRFSLDDQLALVSPTGRVHPALGLSDDLLRRVDVPTSFFWGADDPFGGVDVAERMVELMGDAELEMVADAGHLPWLDDPAGVARAVTRFLRSPSGAHLAHAITAEDLG